MNTGKRKPLDYEEMSLAVDGKKNSKIYRAESGEYVDGEISRLVRLSTEELARVCDGVDAVSLDDTRTVKAKAVEYLRCCEEQSAIPTMTSFCHALGYSEEGMRLFKKNHPNHPTTEFLLMFHERCSELLNQAALRNLTNYTYSIFAQKAKNGYRDVISIEPVTDN